MTIVTRPDAIDNAIGTGDHILRLNDDQLELIIAYLHATRLGQAQYQQAAFELVTALGDEFGDEFCSDASDRVGLMVTVDDIDDNTIFKSIDGYDVILEV